MYDHGPDPIVLDDNNAENFQSDFGSNPPPPGIDTSGPLYVGGNAPEPYNPEAPSLGNANSAMSGFVPNFSVPPPPIPQMMMPYNMQQGNMMMRGGGMGFRGSRGRGRGRFGYSERVPPNKNTTIEVCSNKNDLYLITLFFRSVEFRLRSTNSA
jgi:hypothetical protein